MDLVRAEPLLLDLRHFGRLHPGRLCRGGGHGAG